MSFLIESHAGQAKPAILGQAAPAEASQFAGYGEEGGVGLQLFIGRIYAAPAPSNANHSGGVRARCAAG